MKRLILAAAFATLVASPRSLTTALPTWPRSTAL